MQHVNEQDLRTLEGKFGRGLDATTVSLVREIRRAQYERKYLISILEHLATREDVGAVARDVLSSTLRNVGAL